MNEYPFAFGGLVLKVSTIRKCIARLRVKKWVEDKPLSDREAVQLTCLEMLLDNQLMDGELY